MTELKNWLIVGDAERRELALGKPGNNYIILTRETFSQRNVKPAHRQGGRSKLPTHLRISSDDVILSVVEGSHKVGGTILKNFGGNVSHHSLGGEHHDYKRSFE